MAGHMCPECGTDSRPDGAPRCACAARAAHGGPGPYGTGGPVPYGTGEVDRAAEQRRIAAQHAERTAEAAAAEDFDPLRIRPYVTLGGADTAPAADGAPEGGHDGRSGDAATTMPLFLDPAGPGPHPGPLPDAVAPGTPLVTAGPDPVQPRRRRPFAALMAGAAVVTVVGTAAFIGGLFDGSADKEADLDQAMPSTVATLPEEDAEPTAPASASPTPSATRPASASPSASASASASVSTRPSASATRSAPASPTPSAPSSSPAATPSGSSPALAPPGGSQGGGPTLRLGDRGPEVTELQLRLQEVWVLGGGEVGDDYTKRVEKAVRDFQVWWGVQGDPEGVYGPETRRRLEGATTGRGRD
ncbi:peptidoglycan-binding protein [Streptomyces sp. NPDC057682]|uniref:peptidoglycan-binding domain-containing protein n=1 Tax=Streptomyces sp. NPDC057682 TaxID=3346210 RepID=UPI003673AA95